MQFLCTKINLHILERERGEEKGYIRNTECIEKVDMKVGGAN